MHHSTIWSVLNSENLKTCFFFFPSHEHCLCVSGLYWIFALSYSKLVQLLPSSPTKKNAPLIQSQANTFTMSKLCICPRHQSGLVSPQSTQPTLWASSFAAVQLPQSCPAEPSPFWPRARRSPSPGCGIRFSRLTACLGSKFRAAFAHNPPSSREDEHVHKG